MPLSKAKDRERKQKERQTKGSSRLDVQLRLTPEVADYLEFKSGNKSVGDYILTQLEKAVKVGHPTQESSHNEPKYKTIGGTRFIINKGGEGV